MKYLVLFVVLIINSVRGQHHLLVKPNNEVIPLEKNERAIDFIQKYSSRSSSSSGCVDENFLWGYRPEFYNYTNAFQAYHKDVVATWFTAPTSGTIDTFYLITGSIGANVSSVTLRIHRSNIYPGHGPAYTPFPPPCTKGLTLKYRYSNLDMHIG